MGIKTLHRLEKRLIAVDDLLDIIDFKKAKKDPEQKKIDRTIALMTEYLSTMYIKDALKQLKKMGIEFNLLTDSKNFELITTTRGKIEDIVFDKKILNEFHKKLEDVLGPNFVKNNKIKIDKYLKDNYIDVKKRLVKDFKLPKVTSNFTLVDEKTLNALEENSLFWIGKNYDTYTRSVINNTIKEAVIGGLGRKDAAMLLRNALSDRFTRTDSYWNIVSSAALNRNRNYAKIRAFEQAEIKKYEIVAVLDERTSNICRELDGTQYEISVAITIIEEALNSKDPEDFKTSHPWADYNPDEGVFTINSTKEKIQQGDEEALANAGVALPPFHGRCRTTIIPVI